MTILFKNNNKKNIHLTIDFEDYRYNFNRDYNQSVSSYNIHEIYNQYWLMTDELKKFSSGATFFLVAEVAKILDKDIISDLKKYYDIGCHSNKHINLGTFNRNEFFNDTAKAKNTLEDLFSMKIDSYRAPYFSAEKILDFFYEELSKNNFKYSSSTRLTHMPGNTKKFYKIKNSDILEIPLKGIGFGSKKITIIGGTYFRIMPIRLILKLIKNSIKNNFAPIIYLHNYDFDKNANKVKFNLINKFTGIPNDYLRRLGRENVVTKLNKIYEYYNFVSLNSIF